jgi:hypothetical protein
MAIVTPATRTTVHATCPPIGNPSPKAKSALPDEREAGEQGGRIMAVNTNGYRKLGSGPAGSRAPIRSEHGDSFAGDDPTFHGLQRRETSARDSNVRNPIGLFGEAACC